uniref:Condensin-2 complex subunit D3-like n=1 Tax=Hirondellea gigas TaxID=1518452 RepID=A0A2P2I5C0_9CRUS
MAGHDSQISQVLDLFNKFSLEKLSDEWVTNVIDSDFTEVESLPLDFEDTHCDTNFTALFNALVNNMRQWVDKLPILNPKEDIRKSASFVSTMGSSIDGEEEEEDINTSNRFWIEIARIAKVKNLMSLVFYYVQAGQRYNAKEEDRELGTQAASLYFLILCVPGSNAFRIFHPVLYLKSLDIMRLTTKLNIGAVSPRKGRTGPSATARGSQRRGNDAGGGFTQGDDDDEDASSTILTPQEANKLIRLLNILLSDFIRLTQRFSLKHSPESLDETIGILVDVTRSETHNAHAVFLGHHGNSTVTSLVYNAYVSLQCICSHLHGSLKKIVTLVLKHILNNILMISRGTSDLSLRSLGVIRDHSVIFVKYLLTQIKEHAYDGVYVLVQHLCLRVPDKADFRQKTSQSIVDILRHLPVKLYSRLMKWFFKFSHNEKAGHRLFTLEIISRMLAEQERQAEEVTKPADSQQTNPVSNNTTAHTPTATDNHNNTTAVAAAELETSTNDSFAIVPSDRAVLVPSNRNILSHKFLLGIIFSRCRDSAATVRSKALALLAECTLSDNPTILLAMKQIFNKDQPVVFTTPHIPNNVVNIESPMDEIDEEQQQENQQDDGIVMPNATMVIALLKRRARDDKVTVRKSALQVLENLLKLDEAMVTKDNLKVFCDHCRDPALLVRKQMVTTLSTLVERYPKLVAESWVTGVLPAILDPEMKVQEKVVENLHNVVLGRLESASRRHSEESNELPWLLLSTITKLSFHKFLNKTISVWSKSSMVKPELVEIAKSHIGGEHNEQTWLLLSVLSHCLTVDNTVFAVSYYHHYCSRVDEVGWLTLQQVVRVLCNSVKSIPVASCQQLAEVLLLPLKDVSVGAGLMPPIMDLLTLINNRLHGDEEPGQAALEEWVSPLLKECDEYLQTTLFTSQHDTLSPQQEEELFRRIFLLGEAGLLCPTAVNKRMFLMLQSIIFHGQPNSQGEGRTTSPTHIPSSQTQSSQAPRVNFLPSKRIQAVSVAVLGKLCLQHESQAKRIVPALGRLLDTNPGPDTKTNIIFTLADMCVRYATVVDPLMPQMTSCLKDPDLQVRRTTLTLLISLLQEDYLKLKGSFFYRILQCLCDEQEEMRNTVIFFLTERLLKRFPKVFSQHFIECIFHYNGYEEHESYNRFSQNQQEKELFSLAGEENLNQRMVIYKFMLDHMPDDLRFSITQRLCQDVLGGAVDGRLGAAGCDAVLHDALLVLSCDEIKLATLKARPEDDQATNQEEQAQIAGMAITKTIISQVVKRNVIENIVPILIALKHQLEEQRSPLMKQLLLYLKELMKDYKNEIKEILAGDKQLAEEIEFDLRKFEERQKEEEEQQRREEQEKLLRERQEKRQKQLCQDRGARVSNGTNAAEDDGAEAEDTSSVIKTVSFTDINRSGEASNNDDQDVNQSIMNGDDDDGVATPCRNASRMDDVSLNVSVSLERLSHESPIVTAALQNLSPKRPASAKTSLLKAAVMNSQKITDRRRSLAVTEEFREVRLTGENSPKIKAALEKRRASIAVAGYRPPNAALAAVTEESSTAAEEYDKETNVSSTSMEVENDEQSKSTDDVSNAEAANGGVAESPRSAEVATKSQEAMRRELLRAISTPTRDESIVRNITFINQTQNVSAIGVNSTLDSTTNTILGGQTEVNPEGRSQQTILMHLKDPELYAKDEEFSRLRRNTRRGLSDDFANAEEKKEKSHKKKSGGFLESYNSDIEESSEDSSGEGSLFNGKSLPPHVVIERATENSVQASVVASTATQHVDDKDSSVGGAPRETAKRTRQSSSSSPEIPKKNSKGKKKAVQKRHKNKRNT